VESGIGNPFYGALGFNLVVGNQLNRKGLIEGRCFTDLFRKIVRKLLQQREKPDGKFSLPERRHRVGKRAEVQKLRLPGIGGEFFAIVKEAATTSSRLANFSRRTNVIHSETHHFD
jgi:hypothetical protein